MPVKHAIIWTASSEFGTYRICEQRRFRRACASAQSRQNLRCSLIQALSQEEPSDRKPDLWPLWMAGHAQLKFVMTECSKTQNRLTRLIYWLFICITGRSNFSTADTKAARGCYWWRFANNTSHIPSRGLQSLVYQTSWWHLWIWVLSKLSPLELPHLFWILWV